MNRGAALPLLAAALLSAGCVAGFRVQPPACRAPDVVRAAPAGPAPALEARQPASRLEPVRPDGAQEGALR